MASEREVAASIRTISKSIVLPYSLSKESGAANKQTASKQRTIHLTPWDLTHLSIQYNQDGLLFSKTSTPLSLIISRLETSLSQTLDHFYPLAGRLSTVRHDTVPPSMSISIDCNNQGAEFIVASVKHVTVSDIVSSVYIPDIVNSFFPLNGAINHDGHSLPLLAIQVTELADGIFLGCSLNHSVGDGASFWHFLNSWSEISRTGSVNISSPPFLDRWFLDSCSPPIHLPYKNHQEFITKCNPPENLRECFLNFSADTVAMLKAKANLEMKTDTISSLQALLAHVWRFVVCAWKLNPDEETTHMIPGGNRSRIKPELPDAYFGNCISSLDTKASVGEVMNKGIGWVAWKLNKMVKSLNEDVIRNWLCSWPTDPFILHFDSNDSNTIVMMSSPRFDIYGNDFGWGTPIAVRSGSADKFDGTVTVYPGPERGSMALEICLSAKALLNLLEDEEFMETTS